MGKIKSVVFGNSYDKYKATIHELFIYIRKSFVVPKSEFEAKWIRDRFYRVRKKGDMISCKTQGFIPLNVAIMMKSNLIEKDGKFYLLVNGEYKDNASIRVYTPKGASIELDSVLKIVDGTLLVVNTSVKHVHVKNRRTKKIYKRVSWKASMDGKRTMEITQVMYINMYALDTILGLLEGDSDKGYCFAPISKILSKLV